MTAGQFDCIVYAATATAGANAGLVNAGLREQPREGSVEITGPLRRYLLLDLGSRVLGTRSAAFAEAAIVNGQRADPGGTESLRDRLPRFAIRVAHVQQDHGRP